MNRKEIKKLRDGQDMIGVYEKQKGRFRNESDEIFFLAHKNDESPDQAGDWLGDNNKNWEFVCEKQDL